MSTDNEIEILECSFNELLVNSHEVVCLIGNKLIIDTHNFDKSGDLLSTLSVRITGHESVRKVLEYVLESFSSHHVHVYEGKIYNIFYMGKGKRIKEILVNSKKR